MTVIGMLCCDKDDFANIGNYDISDHSDNSDSHMLCFEKDDFANIDHSDNIIG